MKSRSYYTLVASLPRLPRFDKAERLPINRERLIQRLRMLHPEDLKVADQAAAFLAWRRQPTGRTNADIVAIYNRGIKQVFESPLLKALFEFPINLRTIMVALRRRNLGLPRPETGQPWGAGELVRPIERNWEDATFKLGAVFPWIPQAIAYLKEDQPLKLEYMLMNLMWNKLDALLVKDFFGFDVVMAYLLKWDLIQQWLAYNQEAARKRFEQLVMEATP
jgi:hypothetical protein